MRGRFALGLSFALVGWGGVARAGGAFDDPYAVPDAPRPPTLPELTHADPEATFEMTGGSLLRSGSAAKDQTTAAFALRVGLEVPVAKRRWFVGANYALAAGDPLSGAAKLAPGNLELFGRTVWATPTGLAFGGGVGFLAPTARWDPAGPAAEVAAAAATLRPWDLAFFTSQATVVRPFLDVRTVDHGFVIQFRQGLDIYVDLSDPITGERSVAAFTALYAGYQLSRYVAPGIEVFEQYLVDAPIRDAERAAIVISPSVRVSFRYVQPALSLFTDLGRPLLGNADAVIGGRLAVTFVLAGAEAR